jgi:hypothetical protein
MPCLAVNDFRIASASKIEIFAWDCEEPPAFASLRSLAASAAGISASMEIRALPSGLMTDETEAEQEARMRVTAKKAAPRQKAPAAMMSRLRCALFPASRRRGWIILLLPIPK